MTAREIIKALIPTTLERPAVWFTLAESLIEQGFTFNHAEAEWTNGVITGRIAFTNTAAWLRHRDNGQSHFIGMVGKPMIEVEIDGKRVLTDKYTLSGS
jgi:hypothetical protein